ncbi:MAG: DUF58 domain-containing protein [Bryobacteraceae bacterium]
MPESNAIIESDLLEKLERLTIHWQKSLPGLVGGHNLSRIRGSGQEFLDHRHFHHGDDLRDVNWRAFLRLDKLFLKMFQLEPRVPVRILVDTSRSMLTGGEDGTSLNKFDYARQLAAALCYVGLIRLDTMTIQPFSGKMGQSLRAGGGRQRIQPVLRFLEGLKCGGQTNFMEVTREFMSTYEQRGVVIVISDFLDDADCERPIQYLADFGHEVFLAHVWSEEDRVPPWDGDLDLEDAETGTHLQLPFGPDARAAYTEAFDKFAASIKNIALRNGGRYVAISTATPIEDAVFGPFVRMGVLQ